MARARIVFYGEGETGIKMSRLQNIIARAQWVEKEIW